MSDQWRYSRRRILCLVALTVPQNAFLCIWGILEQPQFKLCFFIIVGLAQNAWFCVEYLVLYRLYMRLVRGSENDKKARRQITLVREYYFFIWFLLLNQSILIFASYLDSVFKT